MWLEEQDSMQNQRFSVRRLSSNELSTRSMKTFAAMMPIPFRIALVVRTASDVATLRKSRNARRMRILLRVSGLPIETSKHWEARLNSALRECGCSLGAKCVIAAFFASIIWQSTFSLWSISHWPAFLLRMFLLILLAGAVGKSVGLVRARVEVEAIEKKIRNFEVKYTAGGQ
jgi:hypothetical protein